MIQKYMWRIGGIYDKFDAQKVGKEIEELDYRTPNSVVEKAKDENTELHNMFEWDDKVAGDKYRLHQARGILNTIGVVVKADETKTYEERKANTVRAFVQLKKEDEYKEINLVVNNPSEYEILLEKAKNKLKNIRAEYSTLTELKEIYSLIDKL